MVRGLSAIAVLIDHAYGAFISRLQGAQSLGSLFTTILGSHAVVVFFLLSGNLITKSILRNIEENGQFDIYEYAISRVSRIYPPLIGSIIICIFVWATLFALDLPGSNRAFGIAGDLYSIRTYYSMSLDEIFESLRMENGLLQVNGPLWSLYVEFHIYIGVMAIAAWWRSDIFSRCFTGIFGLFAASLLLDQPLMVSVWLLGAATALLAKSKYVHLWRLSWVLACATLLVLEGRHTHWDGVFKEAIGGPSLFAFALFYGVPLFFGRSRFCVPNMMARLADCSYSLYIIHFPLLLLVLALTQDWTGHSMPRAVIVLLVTVPTIFIAAAFFASIAERQNFYKRWLGPKTPPRLPAA